MVIPRGLNDSISMQQIMAAVRSPLMPSPSNSLMSAFSPYTDSPSSPAAPFGGGGAGDRSSTSSSRLQPQTLRSPQATSPSDIADPSPIVSSNGTEFDETPAEDRSGREPTSATSEGAMSQKENIKLITKDEAGNTLRPPSSEDEHPPSVILAPKGFDSFADGKPASIVGRVTPTPSQVSEVTVVVPQSDVSRANGPLSPPPISTDVPPVHDVLATPQAQTRQEAETLEEQRRFRQSTGHLEDIPEKDSEADDEQSVHPDDPVRQLEDSAEQVKALRTALVECWTLCNTLAGLSHIHRKRAFQQSRKVDGRERAWETCWTLCQKLYRTWDEDLPSPVGPTLTMCRNFCQDLFEVRQRDNDDSDAVLRVSFELNNHLYNTHDRALPEAYRERTLDFYITLCHRLMKQRNRMAEETDDLLRACWALAEMLFSLRQSKRDGNSPNEELLSSAVQACWELCDIFREGWTQVRPDRGTPRPSRANFTPTLHQREIQPTTVTLDETEFEDDDHGRLNPETPTTVFEDVNQMSPDESSVPNIVVLGPDSYDSRYSDWSSSASSRSGYASSDEKTSSSASTVHQNEKQQNEDPRVTCTRILIVRAAVNLGFQRNGPESFVSFVKKMPSNAFGSQPWQVQLLEEYKRLIAGDSSFRNLGPLRRATATDVARSVSWMGGSGQWTWFRDLYRSVFGFRVEEAGNRPGLAIEGRLIIRDTKEEASLFLARHIVHRINQYAPTPQRPFVLGLPTGSSPEKIYAYLVDFYRRGKISFKNVVTFNMDEYVGLPRDHPQSYHTFMYTHLFAHVDIQPQNVHILDGTAKDLEKECRNYEAAIAAAGGIELFLGGVGSDGHIAFNEPGSSLASRTRVKALVPATIVANARFFDNDESQVPRLALTVGVGTIFNAREVCIIATGAGKAEAVREGVEGSINHQWTITKLQDHQRWLMAVDEEACAELKMKTVKYFKDIEGVAASMGFDAAGLEDTGKKPWEGTRTAKL